MFKLHSQLNADSVILGNLPLCQLLLVNDQQYPWFVLVPRRADISEIYQLSDSEQQILWQESSLVSQTIMRLFNGDKLNVAAIGNLVPQLHIHHVVRFKDDVSWPSPVWGKYPMINYSSEQIKKISQKVVSQLTLADD